MIRNYIVYNNHDKIKRLNELLSLQKPTNPILTISKEKINNLKNFLMKAKIKLLLL